MFVGRGVRALWMGLAHGVGWAVRGVGRQAANARDLDPEHRRDGAGLLLLGLAILTGVAVWFSGAGPVGERVADTVRLFLGAIAAALPLLLLVAALRLMREASDPEHRGRGVVGWSALILSAAGLLHVAQDPIDNAQRDYAGGLVGAAIGGLLERAVTQWVAMPLLVLLFLFGLLVITATPINKVPERLGLLVSSLLGRPLPADDTAPADDDEDEEEEEEPAPVRRRSSSRRRQAALADGAGESSGEEEIVHDTVVLPRKPPAAVPAARKVTEPPEHSAPPTRAEQLAITGMAGDYKLPRPTCSSRAPRPRAGARRTTRSSRRCRACSSSSTWTRRSPASRGGRRSPGTRWSWASASRSSGSRSCRATSHTR
ncbi:hypothetical protein Psuf_050530 [Phytohabitans suffuscus]|uniref:DNA translocase FtsK 4TM region domain-containing protein n=1 Tax=Phytohabitans suffuscus TaxID=624315 RepID=A0A6F8YNP4_9ACTN|nr:hypothetical protein Psuf_050530 [Phytohabitans suffuscus]